MFEVDLPHVMSQFHYWKYFVSDPGGRAHGIYLLTVNSPDIVIGSWQVKDHFMSDPNTHSIIQIQVQGCTVCAKTSCRSSNWLLIAVLSTVQTFSRNEYFKYLIFVGVGSSGQGDVPIIHSECFCSLPAELLDRLKPHKCNEIYRA